VPLCSAALRPAIRKLNYRLNLLACSLARCLTRTLGIIVPDIANPFFQLVVRVAEDAAEHGGYHIVLCSSHNEPAKEELYLELFLSKRTDGILLRKAAGSLLPHLRRTMDDLKVPGFRLTSTTFTTLCEADLDEIYYFRMGRPTGYAHLWLYTLDGRCDVTLTVRDGDVLPVREGYHPTMAGHGYNVYFLNFLAGTAPLWHTEDPNHVWVKSTWKTVDPRLPPVARNGTRKQVPLTGSPAGPASL
jgi:hypothetical protein